MAKKRDNINIWKLGRNSWPYLHIISFSSLVRRRSYYVQYTPILIHLDGGLKLIFLAVSKVVGIQRYSVNVDTFLNVVGHCLSTPLYLPSCVPKGDMLLNKLFIFSVLLWKIFRRRFGSYSLMRIGKGNLRLLFMHSSRIGYMVTY